MPVAIGARAACPSQGRGSALCPATQQASSGSECVPGAVGGWGDLQCFVQSPAPPGRPGNNLREQGNGVQPVPSDTQISHSFAEGFWKEVHRQALNYFGKGREYSHRAEWESADCDRTYYGFDYVERLTLPCA